MVSVGGTGGLQNVVARVTDSCKGGKNGVEVGAARTQGNTGPAESTIFYVHVEDLISLRLQLIDGIEPQARAVPDVVVDAEHRRLEAADEARQFPGREV